jgi:hypothetical protein
MDDRTKCSKSNNNQQGLTFRGLIHLYGCWFFHLCLGRSTFLLPVAMYLYTNLRMRVPLIVQAVTTDIYNPQQLLLHFINSALPRSRCLVTNES